MIAGLTCVDWSWTDDTEMHTACLTDGVLLRLVIDGQIVAEARSVLYAPNHLSFLRCRPDTNLLWRRKAGRLIEL
jgi:hypothetical protein